MTDNFFALGGHSLQAMRLVHEMTAATGHPVAVHDLFLAPTVAELAAMLEQRPTAPALPPTDTPTISAATPPDNGLTMEQRPLLSLYMANKLPPVEAASLYYLVPDVLAQTGLSRETIIEDWYNNLPLYDDMAETHLGRVASILLPRFGDVLYHDSSDLVNIIIEGLESCRQPGGAGRFADGPAAFGHRLWAGRSRRNCRAPRPARCDNRTRHYHCCRCAEHPANARRERAHPEQRTGRLPGAWLHRAGRAAADAPNAAPSARPAAV
ncbi:MAG: hypothetical protein HC876_07255 [Chloroflexaceae bacterium]|nr:hypothetical protein [Chloroflexaceae bacterium]